MKTLLRVMLIIAACIFAALCFYTGQFFPEFNLLAFSGFCGVVWGSIELRQEGFI